MILGGRILFVLSLWLLARPAHADLIVDPPPPGSEPAPREPARERGCAGRLAAGSPASTPLALVMLTVGVAALIGRNRRPRALA